jgi:beta-lactamase superfamily II metal-dependent hydrolase
MKHLILLLACVLSYTYGSCQQTDEKKIKVHYFNVGQAASALVEFPCGAVLIDAGSQDEHYTDTLIADLTTFFKRRTDLNNTLDLIIVTHDHIDHDLSLKAVVEKFTVKKYVDNGLSDGSGKNQKWLQEHVAELGITYSNYSVKNIRAHSNHAGYTDTIVDPISCTEVDPKIILYCGRFDTKPTDWKAADWQNGNNHSLVIKILFGKSSFLFTGDLENTGENNILKYYAGTTVLRADVWAVSHHGADNGTTADFLAAVKPSYAVMSCGQWDFGKTTSYPFTTYKYGHPRVTTLNLLAAVLPGARENVIKIKAATGSKVFVNYTVRKNMYATAWDGNIEIDADTDKNYKVSINQ